MKRRRRTDGRIAAYRTVDAATETEAIEVATGQLLRSGTLRDPMDWLLGRQGVCPFYPPGCPRLMSASRVTKGSSKGLTLIRSPMVRSRPGR